MARARDHLDDPLSAELRARLRDLAGKLRPGEVAQQVEGTRKLIKESRKLLEWVDSLGLV